MSHLGQYEANSDWTWTITLNDEDGSAVDLKDGGNWTVTFDVVKDGAIYLADIAATLNADADGNPPSFPMTAANSTKLPAGTYDLEILATRGGTNRRWRHQFDVVRQGDL